MTTNGLIIISIIGWALWSVANKFAVQKLSPFSMQIVGTITATLFLPFWFKLNQGHAQNITPPHILWSVASCVCATVAGTAYLFAIKDSDLGSTAALAATYPVLTFVMSIFLFNEAFTFAKVIGILFVIVGVAALCR
jgi:drug/metabolite transporter (DMT)-like permease